MLDRKICKDELKYLYAYTPYEVKKKKKQSERIIVPVGGGIMKTFVLIQDTVVVSQALLLTS